MKSISSMLPDEHLCCTAFERRNGFGAVVCAAITAASTITAASAAIRDSSGTGAVVAACPGHADVTIRHQLADRKVYDAQAA